MPLSHVRSTRAAGGMSLKISYSALAVADALLSSTSRANSLRLLRSTCVFMQRLDGAAPTTVSDSKWPNPFLDPTASGRSAMGTRIGMRGPFAFLPFFLVRRFLPRARYWRRFQRPLRLGVDPLVEALVADAHRRVAGVLGLQPSLDQFRAPPPAQRVKHPGAQRARIHATRFPGLAPTPVGLSLRGRRRIERTRGPRPGLQPFRPVGPVRPVLVGREPQAAPQLAAHGGLVPADPLRGPTDAQMLFAMQLLDQDPLLGRQVRILLTHECNTFLS